MSKIATIKRAIEKLEDIQCHSTQGKWYEDAGVVRARVAGGIPIAYMEIAGDDADLIVTLHRTIEPQLTLLRLAVKYGELDAGSGSSFIAAAHDLALSIINERAE